MAAANPFSRGRIAAVVERMQAVGQREIIRVTNERTQENQAAIRALFGEEAQIRRFVDGQEGKPLDQVRPDGSTLTEFELLPLIVDKVLQALFIASPYGDDRDGHYRDDHWLFVNDVRREAAENGAVSIEPTDVVVIINMRPYARAIEGGTPGMFRGEYFARRPGLSVQAPDGVYEITARALRRRFGAIAKIAFAYRSPAAPTRSRGPFPAIEIRSALT